MVFQWAFYYMVDRLLSVLAAQQKRTTARWYSNITSLLDDKLNTNLSKLKVLCMFKDSLDTQTDQCITKTRSKYVFLL